VSCRDLRIDGLDCEVDDLGVATHRFHLESHGRKDR
jgi:hypothetical protein